MTSTIYRGALEIKENKYIYVKQKDEKRND